MYQPGKLDPAIEGARKTPSIHPISMRGIVVLVDSAGGTLQPNCPPGTVLATIPELDSSLDVIYQIKDKRVFIPSVPNTPIRVGNEITITWPREGGGGTYTISQDVQVADLNAATRQLPEGFTRDINDGLVNEPNIPRFRRREGDSVLEGKNNTVLVLSRDRDTTPESGHQFNAGTIFLVAGRKEENLDFPNDAASVVISQQTDIDNRYKLNLVEIGGSSDQYGHESSAVAAKADEIRLIARQTIKLYQETSDSTFVMTPSGQIIIDNPMSTLDLDPATNNITITHKQANTKIIIDKDGNIKSELSKNLILRLLQAVLIGDDANDTFVTYSTFKDLFDKHRHYHWSGPTQTAAESGSFLTPDHTTATTTPVIKVKR